MTDIERYIEKAAEALGARPTDHYCTNDSHDDVRAVLAAVLPDIRRDVGEEIAQAIDNQRCPGVCADAECRPYRDAATIARRMGASGARFATPARRESGRTHDR